MDTGDYLSAADAESAVDGRASREHRARFAQAIRQERVSRGWTAEKASELAGLSSKTWQRLEDGKTSRDLTYSQIDRLFQFEQGTVSRAWNGPDDPKAVLQATGQTQSSETPPRRSTFTAEVLRRYADGLNKSQVDEYTDSDESWNRALGSVRDDLRALASRVEQVESSTLSRLFGGA